MENLAKLTRNTLIAFGLISVFALGYGYYKYNEVSSQLEHLNSYIDAYIENDNIEDAKIIKEYQNRIILLEATIKDLEKKKWWSDKQA